MNIPSRRKLGAIALILAGIAAVGVPLYLWHGGSPQGTSPSPTTPSGNNNNNNGNTAGTTNPNTNTNSGSGGNSCSEHKSHDSDSSGGNAQSNAKDNAKGKDNGNHNGNAFGRLAKQMDTTVALVKSMGTHNSAFHQHHETKTDNHTVHDPQGVDNDSSDHDSSCASAEESNEQD